MRDYDDIPGTYVFDGRRSRQGYPLNQFLMSLNQAENRDAFRADEAAYLDRFPLLPEQRDAVLRRQWLRLLEVGGNLYYTYKLAACDGMSFQELAAEQTGMTPEAYAEMMLAGGRPIDGNRSRSEWAGLAGSAGPTGPTGPASSPESAVSAGSDPSAVAPRPGGATQAGGRGG